MANQMQQMLMQAQRMQRELKKAQDALDQKEFVVSKGGMVEVKMLGCRKLESISIDADALDPDNKEMLEETLVMAIGEILETIQNESDAIQEKVTGQAGFPF